MARTFETFDSVAAELYALPREQFIAARDERVARAKADGKVELAERLGALGKPTTAAWLANQLARQHPDQVQLLGKVGAALRDAHGKLAGEQLRTLSRQRAAVIRGLVAQARELSARPVPIGVVHELEAIFTAALSRASVARELAEGRLTGARQFGDGSGWPLVADAEAVPEPAPGKRRGELDRKRALAKPRREAAEADAAAVRAREAADAAEQEFQQVQRAAEEARDRVQRLTDELAAAEETADTTRQAVKPARRERDGTARAAARAETKAEQLAASLAELEKQAAKDGD